jgi:hypothetical protein
LSGGYWEKSNLEKEKDGKDAEKCQYVLDKKADDPAVFQRSFMVEDPTRTAHGRFGEIGLDLLPKQLRPRTAWIGYRKAT